MVRAAHGWKPVDLRARRAAEKKPAEVNFLLDDITNRIDGKSIKMRCAMILTASSVNKLISVMMSGLVCFSTALTLLKSRGRCYPSDLGAKAGCALG